MLPLQGKLCWSSYWKFPGLSLASHKACFVSAFITRLYFWSTYCKIVYVISWVCIFALSLHGPLHWVWALSCDFLLVCGILVTRMQAETWQVCVPFHFFLLQNWTVPLCMSALPWEFAGASLLAGWERHGPEWPSLLQLTSGWMSLSQKPARHVSKQAETKGSKQPKSLIRRIRNYRNGNNFKKLRCGVLCYAAKATWYTDITLVYLFAMCTMFLPQLDCEPLRR